MTMPSDLLSLVLLFAPPVDLCDEAATDVLIKQGQHSAILDRARLCLQRTSRPYFHYVSGQALYFLDRHAKAKRELGLFLKKAPKSDKHRETATRLHNDIPAPAPAVKPPKPKDTDPKPKDTDPKPKDTDPTDSNKLPKDTAPKSPNTVVSDKPLDKPKGPNKPLDTTKPLDKIPAPVGPDDQTVKLAPPSFGRGWIGLGAAAGVAGATGLAFGIAGGLVGKHAFDTDARALADAGLNASFPYASCAQMASADCSAADNIERNGYSTANFHRDLALASRLQAVAVMASGAGLGGLLGALPIRGHSANSRRVGFIVVLGGGLAIAVAGAAMYGMSRSSLGDSLQGIEGNAATWRTTSDEYWRHQGLSLAGGGLLGLGAGVLVGASVAALTARSGGSPARRAQLRLVPNLGGVSLIGRF